MRAPDGVTQRAAGSLTLPRWDSANAVFLRTHPRAAVNFSPFRSEEPGCRLRIAGWRYEDGETQFGRLFADEIGKRLAGGAGRRREEHEHISPAFWRARRVQERGICQKGPRVLIGNGPGVHERGGRAFRVFPVTFGEGRGRYGRHAAWREQIRPERECSCFLGRRWFPRDDGILRGRV